MNKTGKKKKNRLFMYEEILINKHNIMNKFFYQRFSRIQIWLSIHVNNMFF